MLDKINELIEKEDYKNLKLEITNLNEVDIAEIIEDIDDKKEQVKVFRLLPKDIAADTFSNLPIDIQQELITSLSMKEAGSIIDNLYADDATDLIDEMPANIVTKLLANTTPETRKDINYLLKYPENSAGSIMNIDFVDLKADITLEEAISKLRREGKEKESIDTCFVLDKNRQLLGTIELKELLFNPSDKTVEEVMDDRVISTHTLEDQEEVAKQFSKYDLTLMPVVDKEDRLVGVITIDDVIDVIEEETTEDIEKMAGISPTDKPYMKTSVLETYKKRMPWLLVLMFSATFTGTIIQSYQNALASYVVLTAFIPMFMNTGGNAGNQTSVTVIRGISLNEIEFKDLFRILWKEFRIAILAGITLSAANFVKLLVVDKVTVPVAAVVSLTLIVTVTFAKLVGCMLPMCAKKIGLDPAVMASPFITTIVDAISLITYFNIATFILGL
jgi:magnesium transporter